MECIICLDLFKPYEPDVTRLACSHAYHNKCLPENPTNCYVCKEPILFNNAKPVVLVSTTGEETIIATAVVNPKTNLVIFSSPVFLGYWTHSGPTFPCKTFFVYEDKFAYIDSIADSDHKNIIKNIELLVDYIRLVGTLPFNDTSFKIRQAIENITKTAGIYVYNNILWSDMGDFFSIHLIDPKFF